MISLFPPCLYNLRFSVHSDIHRDRFARYLRLIASSPLIWLIYQRSLLSIFTLAFLTDYLSAGLSAFLSIRILPRFYDMLCHLGPFWAAVFESIPHTKVIYPLTPFDRNLHLSRLLHVSAWRSGFLKKRGQGHGAFERHRKMGIRRLFRFVGFLAFLCFATGSHQSQLGGYNEPSFSLLLGSRRADLCFHDIVPSSSEEILGPKRGAVCN